MVDVATVMDLKKVDRLVDQTGANPESLIGILQDIQREWHYLPIPALKRVSERLAVPYNRVWAVATFYEAFSLKPQGETHFLVCEGTACHVNGAREILRTFEEALKIEKGQTSQDGKFSLETVHCLGACAVGPTVAVGRTFHGGMNREKVIELVEMYGEKKGGGK